MKGIILAGGSGTRMYPMTQVVSKQLLPVYDKPMIYYPLSVLMLAGIRDILIITKPSERSLFESLLGDGSRIGIKITYETQDVPKGLADSFIIGEDFIGNDNVTLILGDNIFYGQDLTAKLSEATSLIESNETDAVIFGYMVKNPEDFGVLEFDENHNVISIEEKPKKPKSNFAVPGLYVFSNKVVNYAKKVKPSKRGEIEITSINEMFLNEGRLRCSLFGRGFAWLDTGTPDGLLRASEFIETVQSRQGFYVSAIEEIAWRRGFISKDQMLTCGKELSNTAYGKYLLSL